MRENDPVRATYTNTNVKTSKRLMFHELARRLDSDYPSAVAIVREGLDLLADHVLGMCLSRIPPNVRGGHHERHRESPQVAPVM